MKTYEVWYDEDYRKEQEKVHRWWIKKTENGEEDKHYAGPFARKVEGLYVAEGYKEKSRD